jgi:hypothetical protein
MGQLDLNSVTDDEITVWLFAIPNITPQTRPVIRENYIRSYNVRQKIARAKESGQFDQVIEKSLWLLPVAKSLENCIGKK